MKIETWRAPIHKIYAGLFYLTLAMVFLRGKALQWDLGPVEVSFSTAKNILCVLFAVGVVCWLFFAPRAKLKTPLDFLFLLWVPVFGISVLLSQQVKESFQALGVVFCYLGFYTLLMATVKKEEQVRKLILLGGLIAGVVCLVDLIYFGYVVSVSPVVPIIEDFPFWPGKNMLGLFSVVNISMAFGFLITPKSSSKKGKVLAFAVLFLNLAVLVVTFSRTAWVGLAVVFLALAVLRPKIFIPVILTGFLALALLAPGGLKGRILSMGNPHEDNVKERLRIWKSAAQMIQDYPLSGVGLGAFHKQYLKKYKMQKVRLKWAGDHAHNLYLHVTAEMGIPGLATLLWMFGFMLRRGWKNYQSDPAPFLKAVRLGAFLALIGYLGYSLTDSTFNGRFSHASMFHINLYLIVAAVFLVREND